jgi:hypothetical protein
MNPITRFVQQSQSPSFFSSPAIRLAPQRRFSEPMRMTTSRNACVRRGRPRALKGAGGVALGFAA